MIFFIIVLYYFPYYHHYYFSYYFYYYFYFHYFIIIILLLYFHYFYFHYYFHVFWFHFFFMALFFCFFIMNILFIYLKILNFNFTSSLRYYFLLFSLLLFPLLLFSCIYKMFSCKDISKYTWCHFSTFVIVFSVDFMILYWILVITIIIIQNKRGRDAKERGAKELRKCWKKIWRGAEEVWN